MLRNYFTEQLSTYTKITADVYDNISYKRVWSGKMMEIGDVVLFALVYPKGEDEPLMMTLLERELEELSSTFEFCHYQKESIPVLRFKGDTKVRNV